MLRFSKIKRLIKSYCIEKKAELIKDDELFNDLNKVEIIFT